MKYKGKNISDFEQKKSVSFDTLFFKIKSV